MTNKSPETPLPKITPGWKAVTTGGYFLDKLPQVKDRILPVINVIGPPGYPKKYTLQLPPEIHNGVIANFSSPDIARWIPPEQRNHNDQYHFPQVPYPLTLVEQQRAQQIIQSPDKLSFYHPLNYAFVLAEGSTELDDPAQQEFQQHLKEALHTRRHTQHEQPQKDTDINFVFFTIPFDPETPILDRIQESETAVVAEIRNRFNLRDNNRLPSYLNNTIVIVTIPEDLSQIPHSEVKDIIRGSMAKIGAMKFIFITADPNTKQPLSYTSTSMEPGHPTFKATDPDCYLTLVDNIAVLACTTQAEPATRNENFLTREQLDKCHVPGQLVRFGKIFGKKGIVDQPLDIEQYGVSDARVREALKLLGWTGQSEGAFAAREFYLDKFLPGGNAYILTATGGDQTPKNDMDETRGDLIAANIVDGTTHTYGVEDIPLKKESVEAEELVRGMEATADITLIETDTGYQLDPHGEIKAKFINMIIHLHRTVVNINPYIVDGQAYQVVEHIQTNYDAHPYAYGCGKEQVRDFTVDAAERAGKLKTAVLGIAMLPNHGIHIFGYMRPLPGTDVIPKDPTQVLIMLEEMGIIEFGKEIPQIPSISTHFN